MKRKTISFFNNRIGRHFGLHLVGSDDEVARNLTIDGGTLIVSRPYAQVVSCVITNSKGDGLRVSPTAFR